MGITDILIILGCLGGGYWLVSSIMSPGTHTPPDNKPPEGTPSDSKPWRDKPASAPPPQLPSPAAPAAATNPYARDWHLILDVPATAGRAEIDAAYRRRLSQAKASGDPYELDRLRLAYEASTSPRSGV